MNIMDILNSYASRPTDAPQDFDEVAREVPASTLGQGLAETFRSDRTPDFGSMAASLFGGSNPAQRAGLLGQLVRAVGPALLSGLAGGALGRLLPGSGAAADTRPQVPSVSAADAEQFSPAQIRDIANAAEKDDPTVLDRVGAYYAEHPEVVKVLGGAALAIALGQIAKRMQR